MWAMISFRRDRFNPHRIRFPREASRIRDEEQTGGPCLLRIEAYLGHEGLGSGCFLFYFGVLGTSAEEILTRYWKLHAVNVSLWGVTRATVLRFESLFCNVENNPEIWREPQNISWVKHKNTKETINAGHGWPKLEEFFKMQNCDQRYICKYDMS